MKFKKTLVTGLTEKEIKPELWSRIKKNSTKVEFTDKTDTELIPHLSDVDCLLVKFNGVTKEMIDTAPNMKYIGVFATGYGKVDTEYAKTKEITVCNVPGYSTQSVSEFVIAVLLEKMRDLERAKKQARDVNYSEEGFTATEIKGKTFGIIGLGRIGQQTARLAKGFGANIIYWSRSKKDVDKDFKSTEIDEVISSSDILSLHLALNDETENFMDAERINKIKKGTIIVNTAPMELVDIDALEKRLASGEITFILDHSDEMTKKDIGKLSKHENCIIYPPIGYITNEARVAKQKIFIENIEKFVEGSPINSVN